MMPDPIGGWLDQKVTFTRQTFGLIVFGALVAGVLLCIVLA